MKKLFFIISLLFISTTSFAANNWSNMYCKGYDTTGRFVYLSASADSPIVNINGDYLRIVGKTKNGKGIVTENFVARNGVVVYDSIVPTGRITLAIFQFNAVTEALLAKANLKCSFSGNLGENVLNMSVFDKLKK